MEQPVKTFTAPMRFTQLFAASFKILFGESAKLWPFAVIYCFISLITSLPSMFLERFVRFSDIGEFFARNAAGLEIAYYVLTLFFYPIYFGFFAHVVSARNNDTDVSFFETIKKACKGYWKLFLINAIYQLVIYGLFSYTSWLDPNRAAILVSVLIFIIIIPCSIIIGMAFPFSLLRSIDYAVSPFKSIADGFVLLFKSGFWQNFGKILLAGLCLMLPFFILVNILTLIFGIINWILPLPVILLLGLVLFSIYTAILAQSTIFMQLLYYNAKALTGQAEDTPNSAL